MCTYAWHGFVLPLHSCFKNKNSQPPCKGQSDVYFKVMFYNKFDTKDNTTWAARKWVCQEAQCQYAWRTVLRMWLCMWLYALQLGKGSPDDYVKGGDIFDIWFDSGVSWATVLKGKCVCERERIGLIPKVNRKFLWKQPRDMHHIYIYNRRECVYENSPASSPEIYIQHTI